MRLEIKSKLIFDEINIIVISLLLLICLFVLIYSIAINAGLGNIIPLAIFNIFLIIVLAVAMNGEDYYTQTIDNVIDYRIIDGGKRK